MQSVVVVRFISEAARTWLNENVSYESWQELGDGIAVEPRAVAPILDAMQDEGMSYGEDFAI